jgi:hypothetical protein
MVRENQQIVVWDAFSGVGRALAGHLLANENKPQVLPLRFASVGMTILWVNLFSLFPQNCHPDRSEAEWRDLRLLSALPLLNMDIPRARFGLDRGSAAIDGSVDMVLVSGAMRGHGERRIRLDRSRAGLCIQGEMGITQPQ